MNAHDDAYFIAFKSTSYTLFSYPVRVELYARKMSVNDLVKLLASKGLVYDFHLLSVVFRGKATNNFNLYYFTHIYNVLGLPMPTPEYLYKSYLRWEEIKAIKLANSNANRVKKGLPPVEPVTLK